MNWREVGRVFGRGLAVVLPAVVTIALIVWLLTKLESWIGGLLALVLGEAYFPGLGILAGVAAVFTIGVLTKAWMIRRLGAAIEALVQRIPLVASLYGAMRDLMGFFAGRESQLSRVVVVELDEHGTHRVLGFVTREAFDDLPAGVGDEHRVAVYLLMSYQIGGYTTIVPRDRVTPIDMSIDQGMRFALFGGVKSEEDASRAPGDAGDHGDDDASPTGPPTGSA